MLQFQNPMEMVFPSEVHRSTVGIVTRESEEEEVQYETTPKK